MKITLQHPAAKAPTYGTEGAACFDLYSVEPAYLTRGDKAIVETGVAYEVPEGHVMLVFSRSGMGFNHGVRLSNCVGVIDSDYRDTVKVALHCDGSHYAVATGDRVAQAMVIPVKQQKFEVVDSLSSTKRGKGGFGSTGK